jgi:alpha-beta hydrolase superfamily lysophospholipase
VWYRHFPDNDEYSDYMLRLINECQRFGADFHECQRTMERIRSRGSTADVWQNEWLTIADRLVGTALSDLEGGHTATARGRYLRAYTYYRSAEYFMPPDDSRLSVYGRGIDAFARGAGLMERPPERVVVEHESTKMPCYFYQALGSHQRPRPAVIFLPGADSTKEELFFQGGYDLLERGVSVLAADGPGQGEMIHFGKVPIRHDFEVPVSALVDFLQTRAEVDARRIGLVGISMGGYYAIRAAAFENRLRATVAWSAIFDVVSDVFDFFPPIRPQLRWITQTEDEAACRNFLKPFRLDGIVGRAEIPILVVHGSEDPICDPKAADNIAKNAGPNVEVRVFGPEEGGSGHVMADNYAHALPLMFDWLVDRLVE